MKYTQTTPCKECPFTMGRTSFSLQRLKEFASGEFPCHKSAELVEDETGREEYHGTSKSVVCAGMLIFNEKRNTPNQMMRIAERLGMYDRTKLNMEAKVR